MNVPAWTVVLPLKGGPDAKSRLSPGPGLAEAIALDCLAAVLAAGVRVLVVTGDAGLASRCTAMGAHVVRQDGAGLTDAVATGLASAGGGPVAVLLGDLPALHPGELLTALAAIGDGPAFVPDADGKGTVLLAGATPAVLHPAFGPDSARAHEDAGALRLELDLPGLRRDVDTPEDLTEAAALGLGPRTRALTTAPPPPRPPR